MTSALTKTKSEIERRLTSAWLTLAEFGVPMPNASAGTSSAVQGALVVAWQTLSRFGMPLPQPTDLLAYIKFLGDVLTMLEQSGATDRVQAAMVHIEYLADKAGCESAVILGGADFTVPPPIILDFLVNINNVLEATLNGREGGHSEDLQGTVVDSFHATADTDPALRIALDLGWETLLRFHITPAESANLSDYFKNLNGVLMVLNKFGKSASVAAIMNHVDYLAYKVNLDGTAILEGRQFSGNQQIILEAISNIDNVLRSEPQERLEVPDEVFALILEAEATLIGWCSREKALMIARTVLQERPLICVEIGVFGGRSLVPCAAALRHNGAGVIYGIEAWSPTVATENVTNELNDDWWSKVDFTAIKLEFYRFIAAMNITSQVRMIESPSGPAAALFDAIDFLHIDGSHSMVNAAEDVILYGRKVRAGGIIIFDDVNWQSTAPARELLAALCDPVAVLKDPGSGLEVCAVMRRR